MKKVFICLFLLEICGLIFSQENKTVKITVYFSLQYGGGTMEIYNGSYQGVAYIMNKLSEARRISPLFMLKEALVEGTYSIDVYQNNVLIQSYTVKNSQNVIDETNDKPLRSTILTQIRGEFLYHLLRDRYDDSL
jgi:hypothetical protein